LFRARADGRRFKRIMQPVHKISIGEEVQAQHRRQVGQGPPGLGEVVQPLEEQQGDQGCPNLDAQGIFAGPDEGLHLEVLLERLEEQLYLPAVLVNGADGRGPEGQVVGEQHDLALILHVPGNDTAQLAGALRLGVDSGETDDLVGEDVASQRRPQLLDNLVDSVPFHSGHEKDALFCPLGEEAVVSVSPIHGHDRAGRQPQQPGRLDVVSLGGSDGDEGWHIVVMIQDDMRLDASLGSAELCPREKGQAERDGCRVEGEQLVLETKFRLAGSKITMRSEVLEGRPEEVLIEGGGPVLIGIGEGRAAWRLVNAQVNELSETAGIKKITSSSCVLVEFCILVYMYNALFMFCWCHINAR